MQPALHRRESERQKLRALLARKAFDVAQEQDLAIRRGERRECAPHRRAVGMRRRRIRRTRLSPAGCSPEIVQRDDLSGFADPAAVLTKQSVPRDREEPGARRVAPAKLARAPPGGEKRLLQRVLDRGRVRREEAEIAERRPLMPFDEARERGGVARGARREQRRVAQRFATGHVLMPRIE